MGLAVDKKPGRAPGPPHLEGNRSLEAKSVMSEEIEEGRDLFKSRVTPVIYEQNIYDRAIVDVLVKSKGHVKSTIW